MVTDRGLIVSASNGWMLIFGLGFGLLFGVILASGLSFDRADAARFIGALLGAMITVAGAVSLFFLREHRDYQTRRSNLIDMLETTDVYAGEFLNVLERHFDDKARVCASAEAFQSRYDRVVRFVEKYEFDDPDINESLHWLDKPNTIMKLVDDTAKDPGAVTKDQWSMQLRLQRYAVQRSLSSMGQRAMPDLSKVK